MSSSGGSLDTSANSHPANLSFINSSSFFDLEQVDDQTDVKREEVCETTGGLDFPTFPLPLSPFFSVPDGLSPTHFLDSPFFLSNSNLLPSPTTEAFPAHLFNSTDKQENSGFTFATQTNPGTISSSESIFVSSMTAGETYKGQQQPYMYESFTAPANNQPIQTVKEQKQFEDGYNWRKYGQKQVKGSENPRSYYKCSLPNCPTKKIVEICVEGKITEIIYKGSHNHPKPQFTRRSSAIHPSVTVPRSQVPHEFVNTHMVSSMTPENSSSSNGEDDFDGSSQRKRSGGDAFDEDDQPEAKKWNEGITGSGIRALKEAKVIVQTTSDIDILDDGYRWRKYGQKVVKGNPNPRSYYKCTNVECPVRKHVERASHDMKAVITTYEGKHNHDVPAARSSGYHLVNRSLPDDNNSNKNLTVPIRPLAQSLPASQGQAHFTIEMLQNRMGGNRIPEYNSSLESLINQLQRTDGRNVLSERKEEPRKDFLESFLC